MSLFLKNNFKQILIRAYLGKEEKKNLPIGIVHVETNKKKKNLKYLKSAFLMLHIIHVHVFKLFFFFQEKVARNAICSDAGNIIWAHSLFWL